MTELDTDFAADDEVNPFENETTNAQTTGANYDDEAQEEENEDDDLNSTQKAPQRITELDDSDDELDETQKHLQHQLKTNFNNLFANKSNMDENDCVIQEEIESKEYNKEHGEQKMEPFNLREERTEGYFDQFLNYHKTKNEETDPFYMMIDEKKEKHEKKENLSADVIEKHKRDYEQFEQAESIHSVDLLREWKSLLPLFSNETNSIAVEIQSLSQIIKRHTAERPVKKRKLNNENGVDPLYTKKKKKKRKRKWEIASDDEENVEDDNRKKDDMQLTERELLGYNRKFALFSEKATMLFANGDHNIYEQTRSKLIRRIRLVESRNKSDEILWEYYLKDDEKKEKHGPFSTKQMHQWNEVYFKKRPIMCRKIRGANSEWICSQQINFAQYMK